MRTTQSEHTNPKHKKNTPYHDHYGFKPELSGFKPELSGFKSDIVQGIYTDTSLDEQYGRPTDMYDMLYPWQNPVLPPVPINLNASVVKPVLISKEVPVVVRDLSKSIQYNLDLPVTYYNPLNPNFGSTMTRAETIELNNM